MSRVQAKIAFTGEGKGDYSRNTYDSKQKRYTREGGPAAEFAATLFRENEIEPDLKMITREEIDHSKIRLQRSVRAHKLNGKGMPAYRFQIIARGQGLRYGIYFCDADRDAGTKNSSEVEARKRFEEIYSQVKQGLKDDAGEFRGIPMIALRIIECWILADRDAVNQVLGGHVDRNALPSKPELVWGDKSKKDSKYPKNILDRIAAKSRKGHEDWVTQEEKVEIAGRAAPDVLERKCPVSYSAFRRDVYEMAEWIRAEAGKTKN